MTETSTQTSLPLSSARALNIVTRVQQLALHQPEDIALVVVSEQQGQLSELSLTYQDLNTRSRNLAAYLQANSQLGDRVLLMFDNNEHYVVSFLACLYAGLIAVPLFVPESARSQHLARVVGIGVNAQANLILAKSEDHGLVNLAMENMVKQGAQTCQLLNIDTRDFEQNDDWQSYAPKSDDIAFLQYTSGSTADPKGVMVSHGNLMANEVAITEGFNSTQGDVIVSWLPLYHDMGLIGSLLQPLYLGAKCVLMSPRFFLEKPIRWLAAIARHRATVSGGPDFSYRLCVERIKANVLAELDLSCWQVAFSGAEPVRHDTLTAFIDHMATTGFNSAAIVPCYGLAEATLFITCGQRFSGLLVQDFDNKALAKGQVEFVKQGGTKQVACGYTVSAHELKIVDPNSLDTLNNGQVGEIWASGPSIAQGYWQNAKATDATFVEQDNKRWLRTGDLGASVAQQLYIVGRAKDLIINRGRNLYPQDLEKCIESQFEYARKGRVAAFSVEGLEGEGIGIALELARRVQKQISPQVIVDRLAIILSELCGDTVSVVIMMQPGSLPKTSSGKLQRRACHTIWQNQAEEAYAIYAHGKMLRGQSLIAERSTLILSKTEEKLADIWSKLLPNNSGFGKRSHFLACGGNSIKATQLLGKIQQEWQITIPLRQLFELPLLTDQAMTIEQAVNSERTLVKQVLIPHNNFIAEQAVVMSHAQARQWFIWQIDPQNSAYNIGACLDLNSKVSAEHLQTALNLLVVRHPVLRTRFSVDNIGQPIQILQTQGQWPLKVVDLSFLEGDLQQKALTSQSKDFSQQSFDLSTGPLVRAVLFKLGDAGQKLMLVMHHIISDGASMQIIFDELAKHYQAEYSGQPVILPEQKITYADYAVWQREYLASGETARQLAWWTKQLGQEQPILQLTTDFPRTASNQYEGAHHRIELPMNLVQQLRQQGANQQASLFMIMLANFNALLYRHSGQTDLRVGIPIANRHWPQTEPLLGFFANTQVIPSQVNGQMSLTDLVEQIKKITLGAQEHQDLPFEYLVEAMQIKRSADTHPLFQVMFSHSQHDSSCWHDLLASSSQNTWQTIDVAAQFELTLESYELENDQIVLEFVYAKTLFSPETIERMAGHYVTLLQAFAELPNQHIEQVKLLGHDEYSQLTKWGAGAIFTGKTPTVHALFEQQVEQQPQATALIFAQQTMTYAELNQAANRLAYYLLQQNIQPEDRVGMALERGFEMIVALLAIWKAGAAYVPLDPAYPKDRLTYMIADSGVQFVLTQQALQVNLPDSSVPLLNVEQLNLTQLPNHNPNVLLHDQHLAYVIYTSGSTGRPKGVAVTHGPLSMHIQTISEVYGIDEKHRELQFFSINFDAAGEQWMTPLAAGGSIVLARKEQLAVDNVASLITQHQVTSLHLPPAYLRLLTPLLNSYQQIRICIVGGEAFNRADYHDAHRAFSAPRIVNAYGPTETIITPTAWLSLADTNTNVEQVPIGRPVGDRQVHVLDGDLNPVPQGASGELYIGGLGIARGYLARPDLTADRFIADLFANNGGRLYRTGDLVRWNVQGQLDYLGRIDHQVKIRGLRIELGEIETQLMTQVNVKEAVVLAKESSTGPRLVAYVGGDDISALTLKQALSQHLPDYMVPSVITVLTQLPVTTNGKIDRQNLPEPQWNSSNNYQAPISTIGQKVTNIWAQVLGIERVGMKDNFFDLGGHSLLLGQMQQQLEAEFEVKLTMLDLFNMTSVSAMTNYFEQLQSGQTTSINRDIQKASQRGKRQRQTFLKKTRTRVES
ncbi:non-ribosomal peptide synthetase [Colwellia psychrerythraea]|uniref:Amino acid adenylation domain protein n=1 Tax=Colwellia psychrerythraea TaxID=28229 RepID=A0A099L3T6_COLPS|nr:non-ribosomal peptide synthetase [Colwellia psychrerythraea]KGJ97526.1 amino acid adenylation domain protein [Colwellia psychrerythraea]